MTKTWTKPEIRTVTVTPEMLNNAKAVLDRRNIKMADDTLVLVYAAMTWAGS